MGDRKSREEELLDNELLDGFKYMEGAVITTEWFLIRSVKPLHVASIFFFYPNAVLLVKCCTSEVSKLLAPTASFS